MSGPLIGITGRRRAAAIIDVPWGFADAPVDLYLSEYASSVTFAGGLPVHLPLEASPEHLVDRIDALVIAGGEDVDPRLYGQVPGPRTTTISRLRDVFECRCIVAALKREIPVLGICRGTQILNVALGGTLVPDLVVGEGESHNSLAYHRSERVHRVTTVAGTTVAGVYGAEVAVNSFHHQATDQVGAGLVVAARADDGVIEAIEMPGLPVIGVQWHPESLPSDPLFQWLVTAAKQ